MAVENAAATVIPCRNMLSRLANLSDERR